VRGDGEEAIAPTYVVECYWPSITEDHVRDALARLARIPQGTASHGDFAHCIGCILVPSDGLALFLFEGPSAAIVQSRSAGQRFRSIGSWRPFRSKREID
jgi:hypothetical protein